MQLDIMECRQYTVCCDILCIIGEYIVDDGKSWLQWCLLSKSIYSQFKYHIVRFWVVYSMSSAPAGVRFDYLQFTNCSVDVIEYAINTHKPRFVDMSRCGIKCDQLTINLDGIEYLDCSMNEIGGEIHADSLRTLLCSFTCITSIQCPNLRKLCCTGCEYIKLPIAGDLRHLECCSSRIIGEIPHYPHLEYINAYNNYNLSGVIRCKNNYIVRSGLTVIL